jgi:hypothetical protein
MALELSPPENDFGMDHLLFDIVTNENGNQIVQTLTPIARMALLKYHGESLITRLGLEAENAFERMALSRDVKERVAELYIITRMDVEVEHITILVCTKECIPFVENFQAQVISNYWGWTSFGNSKFDFLQIG